MDHDEVHFMKFITEHGKSYGTKEEYHFRLSHFKKSLAEIKRLNHSQKSSTHGVNKFSDWTPKEMKKLLGYKKTKQTNVVELDESTAPDALDWRTENAVT
jgi:hypothetical protein